MEFGEFTLAPDTSTYQGLKLLLAEFVPIDRDILHIVLGALVLICCALVLRRDWGRIASVALLVSLGLALGMEGLDARDDLASFGVWRWQAAFWDVLRTIAVPALALLTVRLRRRTSD